MSVKIVVLDDGDSWAGNASILELTDEAYERLIDGAARIKDLDGEDIISEQDLGIRN